MYLRTAWRRIYKLKNLDTLVTFWMVILTSTITHLPVSALSATISCSLSPSVLNSVAHDLRKHKDSFFFTEKASRDVRVSQHFINPAFCNIASLSRHKYPKWITRFPRDIWNMCRRTDRDYSRPRSVQSLLHRVSCTAVSSPWVNPRTRRFECSWGCDVTQVASSIRGDVTNFPHQIRTSIVILLCNPSARSALSALSCDRTSRAAYPQ